MTQGTAHHEAGHVVVAVKVGRNIGYVRLKKSGKSLSTVHYEHSDVAKDKMVMVFFAGDIAEKIFSGEKTIKYPGREYKWDSMQAHGGSLDKELPQLYSNTGVMLRKEWEAVQTVADWFHSESQTTEVLCGESVQARVAELLQ